jgi:hypothetical protein
MCQGHLVLWVFPVQVEEEFAAPLIWYGKLDIVEVTVPLQV